jgi:hypothetical protein
MAFLNEEETEADIIQMAFTFAGSFDPAVTYRSDVKEAAFVDAE